MFMGTTQSKEMNTKKKRNKKNGSSAQRIFAPREVTANNVNPEWWAAEAIVFDLILYMPIHICISTAHTYTHRIDVGNLIASETLRASCNMDPYGNDCLARTMPKGVLICLCYY